MALSHKLLTEAVFNDEKRLKDLLQQHQSRIAMAIDNRKTAKRYDNAECMFLTCADDPPPFLASSAEDWDECDEDPREAYKRCCEVYEERQKRYCDEKGNPCNFGRPYMKKLPGDESDEE